MRIHLDFVPVPTQPLPAILGQRVTIKAADASYRKMVRRWGEPAPGPIDARTGKDAGLE